MLQSNRLQVETKSPASGMQQAPSADFNDGVARSGDVDWDRGPGRVRGWGRRRSSQRGGELRHAGPAAEALDGVSHGVAQDGCHLQSTRQTSRHDSPSLC